MKSKSWWLLFILILFVVALYLWRDILFLKIVQSFLAQNRISFSCGELSLKRGKLEVKDLKIVQDHTYNLFVEKVLARFSLLERTIDLEVYKPEGFYQLSPQGTFKRPPSFLDKVSLYQADLRILGEKVWRFKAQELRLCGVKRLRQALEKASPGAFKALGPTKARGPSRKPSSSPGRPNSSGSNGTNPVQINVRIDLKELPLPLPKGFEISRGELLISLGSQWKDKDLPWRGRFFLKGLTLSGPRGETTCSGRGTIKGLYQKEKKKFSLTAQGELDPKALFFFSLKGEKGRNPQVLLNFDSSPGFWKSFFRLYGLSFSANIRGEIKGTVEPLELTYHLQAKNISFELSTDRIGENINLTLDGRLFTAHQNVYFSGSSVIKQGEIYLHPWYYALKEPLSLNLKGVWKGKNQLVLKKISLKGPFKLEAKELELYPETGWPKESFFQLEVQKFWKPFVQEAFSESHPSLKKINPAGKFSLRQQGSTVKVSFEGLCHTYGHLWKGIRFYGEYDLLHHLCLPFSLSWARIEGRLLNLGPLTLRGQTCGPRLVLNPFETSLWGGRVSCQGGNGRWEKGPFFLLQRLSLESLRPPLPSPYAKLKPRLDGTFEEVLYRQGRVLAKGKLYIKLAKGILEVRDIFFEPGIIPRYGGNIEIRGLDLALLTEVTGFGLITGRLNGRVKDLVMAGILPESFELWLEDDPTYRGPRRISIEAVQHLSELGGSPASGIFIPFAKNLRYQRLGLYCRLKNDHFYLRGLIHKGGKEYLVKGPKLLGVDVINQNPKGAISFKEMVRRLKSILGGVHEKKDLSRSFDLNPHLLRHDKHLLPFRRSGEGGPGDHRRSPWA